MSSKLPNFLIAGTAKCGTTSVHRYLKQHPEIYMPAHKEPMFMVSEVYEKLNTNDPRYHISEEHTVFTLDNYEKLFENVTDEIAIGEASTPYLYHHKYSIPKIKRLLGDVKIIIFLRNPVDRAFSAYKHFVKETGDTDSFEQFLNKENERVSENWDILTFPKGLGFYYNQVKAFQNNFSRVRIYLLDDLYADPDEILFDIYSFLEVDTSFKCNTSTKHNKSDISDKGLLGPILAGDNILKDMARPVLRFLLTEGGTTRLVTYLKNKNKKNMKPKTRKYMLELFREDILKLQELLHRDLSMWLKFCFVIIPSSLVFWSIESGSGIG